MKLYWKASAIGAVLALVTAFVSADSIQLGSYQTGGPNLGNGNTAVAFVGGSTTTFTLNPDGVWAAAGDDSVWVSNNAGSGPGGSVVEPTAVYSYTTTFTTLSSNYTGSISILADDTADVIFNGHTLEPGGSLGTDAHCASGPPNCTTPTLITLPTRDFLAGLNTLQFDVQQEIAETGLDFSGSVTSAVSVAAISEPGTLLLLGTGLIGFAGALMRRSRAKLQTRG
jgi:PEP-CTERM motif